MGDQPRKGAQAGRDACLRVALPDMILFLCFNGRLGRRREHQPLLPAAGLQAECRASARRKKQLESHKCLHATAWKNCADTLSLFPIFSLSSITVGVFMFLHHPQASEGGMLCNGYPYEGKLSDGTGGQGPSPPTLLKGDEGGL